MRILRLEQLIVSVTLSPGIAVPAVGSGAAAVQGDPAAKLEIAPAFQRLNALPSYRMKGANDRKDGMTAVVEVVPPDKTHVTLYSPQGTYEGITVGRQSAFRITKPNEAAGWQCTPGSGGFPAGTAFNIDKIRQDLEATPLVRMPDTVIDGTPVHAYADASRAGNLLYVGAKTGLPRRFVDADPESGGTMDFYDCGAKIAITLPPCK